MYMYINLFFILFLVMLKGGSVSII